MSRFINISNQRFGFLVAESYRITRRKGDGVTHWTCKCDCGNTIEVPGGQLTSGKRVSCGCRPRTKDISGQRFNFLIARTFRKITRQDGSKGIVWICDCDCGNTRESTYSDLRAERTISCGCKIRRNLPDGTINILSIDESHKKTLYRRYIQGAEERNKEFSLTYQHSVILFVSNCHYCGSPPSQSLKYTRNGKSFLYNGIDRIDSSMGYTMENSVACCWICNRAKHSMSYEKFLSHVSRIYNNLISISTAAD